MAHLDFIEAVKADPEIAKIGGHSETGYWAIIEGKDGKPEMIDDCFASEAEAMKGADEFREEYLKNCQLDHESAVQAGMGMGLGAYNDCMNY